MTGAAGFIGANFVYSLLAKKNVQVLGLDKLTYAGHRENLAQASQNPSFHFVHGDIADAGLLQKEFQVFKPTAVVNLAAETHVDRSIDGPSAFIQTNLVGTFQLLQTSLDYWKTLPAGEKDSFRFLHVSTDEVYGSIDSGLFSEETPYRPNSPYSASKAGADHLARAYKETYGLPVLITNCSNNYGPFQFPEKLIPLMILNALEGKKLPVYGDGKNIRDWLYVEDHCAGIHTVLEKGRPGEKYNIGGSNERTNIELVETLCDLLEKIKPAAENDSLKKAGAAGYRDLISFVKDRPGHDRRYAIDAGKIKNELGWKPATSLEEGMKKTIQWYVDHPEWASSVQKGAPSRERQGLPS